MRDLSSTVATKGVATIYQLTALKTDYVLPEGGFFLIISHIILTCLYVNGRNTELWMQEMPPHVTLPLIILTMREKIKAIQLQKPITLSKDKEYSRNSRKRPTEIVAY